MKKLFSVLLLLLLSLALLVSCGGDGGSEDDGGSGVEYTVSVSPTTGISITSTNPLKVKAGESASFDVKIAEGYVLRSVSAGNYDTATEKLTLSNVRSDVRVQFTVEEIDLDAETCVFKFFGTEADTASQPDGAIEVGVGILLTAGSKTRTFLGWSYHKPVSQGGVIASGNTQYSVTVSPTLVGSDGAIKLYANYAEPGVIYYDANDGIINMGSSNLTENKYYTLEATARGVKLTYSNEYYNRVGAASLFWDDGSFTRDGCVLKEYNTRADGSGTAYSLGSKFPMNTEDLTLYCIWAKDSTHTDFEYEDIYLPVPPNAKDVQHWAENGIVITAYNGNSTDVTVPEKIDGKYVTAIAAGAFTDKRVETLVLSRRIIKVEDGAFVGCTSLKTIHYPDGIYYISSAAFDAESFDGVKNFYVNATIAPRFSSTLEGAFSMKLTSVLTSMNKSRIVVVAGSSTLQGLSSEYLEALLEGEYKVVNFGTTRTTHGAMYLEAMGALTSERDIVLYAPENSIYMLGEPSLYWKTIRDLESMYNIFRHIDISNYDNVISAFAELNGGYSDPESADPPSTVRYERQARRYEDIIEVANINEHHEYMHSACETYVQKNNYSDYYEITLNARVRSALEGLYNKNNPTPEEDKWCNMTDAKYVENLTHAINAAKSSGAKVCFAFAPVDADKITSNAKGVIAAWCAAYDKLILDTYTFDGVVGSSLDYIFNHQYFYNNAYHTNYYGRVWRTYVLYTDLAEMLGISEVKDHNEVGTEFEGCKFEEMFGNSPLYKVSYIGN